MREADWEEGHAPQRECEGSLDDTSSADRMRLVDAAMQHYFETPDWLKQRSKVFPGLFRRRNRTGPEADQSP